MHVDLADSWNYILASLDVVGLVALRAVGKKDAKGWLWAMLTQAVWMVYSVSTFQWGFLAVAAVKFGVYTWNWVTWVRGDKAEEAEKAVEKEKTREELALALAKLDMPNADGITLGVAASFIARASKASVRYQEKLKRENAAT